jgi:spore coat protein U-like protein
MLSFSSNSLFVHVRAIGITVALCAMPAISTAPASAATSTANFQVTATVAATCVISATNLAFGTYAGVQTDSTSTLSATCTNTTPYTVGLSVGAATGATATARSMTGPAAALLGYALYRDAARTLNWGFTAGTDTVGGTGNGAAQTLTVYGRVAAGQYVAPGAYTDTITATITF